MRLPAIRLSENLNLLLVSFAISFIIWIFAKAIQTEETRLDIPVLVATNDPRIETRITPDHVSVRFRYPKDLENYISSENFHFRVDTSGLDDNLGLEWNSKTQPLTERDWVANIPQPSRVQLVQIGQRSNTVMVEMRWNAESAVVEPDIVGEDKLPQGIQLVRPVQVTPREVYIVGEPAVLKTMPIDELTSKMKVLTEPINVSQYAADPTKYREFVLEPVRLKLPQGVDVVDRPTKMVEANLHLQEIQTVREIRNVKLDFDAVAPEAVDLEYKEKSVTVSVFGPQRLLRTLTPDSFEIRMIRPAEEVPGTTREVLLEAHFTSLVPEEAKTKLTVRSVEPKSIKIKYVAKELPSPSSSPARP